jgi:hypothetical protein
VGLLLRDLKVALSSIVISANAMLNKPLNKRNESPSTLSVNSFFGVVVVSGSTSYSLNKGDTVSWVYTNGSWIHKNGSWTYENGSWVAQN